MTDIISAIDAATGCQHCGNPLGSSPSSDFCSEFCQATWHESRLNPAPRVTAVHVTVASSRPSSIASGNVVYQDSGVSWINPASEIEMIRVHFPAP